MVFVSFVQFPMVLFSFITIEFWEFFIHSKSFVKYVVCRYFLPVCSSSFHPLYGVFCRAKCKSHLAVLFQHFSIGLSKITLSAALTDGKFSANTAMETLFQPFPYVHADVHVSGAGVGLQCPLFTRGQELTWKPVMAVGAVRRTTLLGCVWAFCQEISRDRVNTSKKRFESWDF